MPVRTFLQAGLGLLCLLATVHAAAPVDFTHDVRPILSNKCFACHGPDEAERHGGLNGLRFDVREGALEDLGDGSQAIVPGKPDDSRLLHRVTSSDPDERMPPADFGKPLTPKEIDILRRWIEQGAEYAPHWAYRQPVRPSVPEPAGSAWGRNPVDRFLLNQMQKQQLAPSKEADRVTLIRRVTLDLTGLPPTLEEVDAFLADRSDNAYEKLVDRLLKSEAYGEHSAKKWLDLARYADSAGYADDPPRTIWAYRDWCIRAFNSNMPFDQFTREQLAGDLLPHPTEDQLIATAFHRNTMTNSEGGTDDEEFRVAAIVDRVNTTMAVWMGTTMACAQCHTHKYDPITQEEYFRFYAFLNNTADADKRDESPFHEIYTAQQKSQREQWRQDVARLKQELNTSTPELETARQTWEQTLRPAVTWTPLTPESITSGTGIEFKIDNDGSIHASKGANKDTWTVSIPITEDVPLQSLRLEALTDPSLPAQGPGYQQGNFVLSRISATVLPPESTRPTGRFVRVDLPGAQKILALAEVQVFNGEENIARAGKASQSTTTFDGEAPRAIDGNTSGDYFGALSTTHTAQSSNPWWEVDLGSEQAVDRIVLWNRTDGALHTRLAGCRVTLFDAQRKPVWQETLTDAPNPSRELTPTAARPIPFTTAAADFTQSGFNAADVIAAKSDSAKGWAIGGGIGAPHEIVLAAAAPLQLTAGSTLQVTLEQTSKHDQHTLGRFRLSITADARAAQRAALSPALLAVLEKRSPRTDAADAGLRQQFLKTTPLLKPLRDQLAKVEQQLANLRPTTTVPILRDLPETQRRETRIQIRGNFLDTGEAVTEGVPVAFGPIPDGQPLNRLTLANWLVSPDNPLTARVVVNRLWENVFGLGLVRTSEDFGSQGDLPSHPELLDWLAVEFMESGWNIQHMLRLMVTSAAYRQTSLVSPDRAAKDADNRWLSRGPRFRLTAEMVRDQSLAAAGLLSRRMYGPPVRPPQPNLGLNAAFGGSTDWKTSEGEDRYRRAIYVQWRRSNPYPSMATFDAPNQEVCTVRRDRTNTPLQALVTLNDPVYVEAAQALGRKIAAFDGSLHERMAFGFRTCLSRPPSDAELARLVALFESAREGYADQPDAAKKLATDPLGPLPEGADPVELAAWTLVSNVLLNLDEMLMKR